MLFIAVVALPGAAHAQGLMVTGYADFASYSEEQTEGGRSSYFDAGHFNLVFLGQIYGDLFAAAELEYENAGVEANFEYGYLGYTGFKDVRIMAGKFLIPFGRFNKDIHASWINKMVGPPLGYGEVLPAGYSDVGGLAERCEGRRHRQPCGIRRMGSQRVDGGGWDRDGRVG